MAKQSPVTRILVIRHGETLWNAVGKQQGQSDAPLSELGVAQAHAIAESIAEEGINALYSSDLGRALETARIIAKRLGLNVQTDVGLRERHLGIMQGLTMKEFQQQYPAEYENFSDGDPDWIIPGGESARQRFDRAVACACELAGGHVGQHVAIVTHVGILESLFRHTVGLGLTARRCFSLYNASINTFSVSDGRWGLERWGGIHHLKGLGTKDDW